MNGMGWMGWMGWDGWDGMNEMVIIGHRSSNNIASLHLKVFYLYVGGYEWRSRGC